MALNNIFWYYNIVLSACSFRGKLILNRRNCSLYRARTLYNMKTAYFQYVEEEQRVLINISYNENNINRVLHFERNVLESVDFFKSRLELKLQNAVGRKLKKLSIGDKSPINLPEFKTSFILNNKEVSGELKFLDIIQNKHKEKYKLRIVNSDYDILINFPLVKGVTLPKNLGVGTIIFPESLTIQFTDLNKSDFVWYKSLQPGSEKNWLKCGETFMYVLKNEDKGYYIKLSVTPKMEDKVGPVYEAVSMSSVTEFEGLKEIKKRHEYTKSRTNSDEFRVVSYNILADTYTHTKEAKTELFTFCVPVFLDFTYRKSLLYFELIGYNADIICLQEVDLKFYNNNLQFLFNNIGYDCIFNEKGGTTEGCLFLYYKSKFNVLNAAQYTFSKELTTSTWFKELKSKIEQNKVLFERFIGLTSQIQVVVLESVAKEILIIGNTHFYFHPDADHIRLLQGIMSWKILENVAKEFSNKVQSNRISILICGDLNSTPECGFHQLMKTGFINKDHIDWKSKEDETVEDVFCQHSAKMKSAYSSDQYTNYTPLFKGCLDYIYYQSDYLNLKQTVPIPSQEVLGQFEGIPSKFFPSDHVALVADFEFKKE